MEIKTLSEKRGILSIYSGDKYIILSTYYGVVAESTKIERSEDNENVKIDFNICEWFGYWDLKSIITRGIIKLEKRYIENKKVAINYTTQKGQQEHLNKYLKFELLEY